jgi:integrase
MEDAKRHKTAVESRLSLGSHYVAAPDTFGAAEKGWYDRYLVGLESKRRPREATVKSIDETRKHLAPIRDLRIDQVGLVELERLVLPIAADAPRRAEMVLALSKRIVRAAQRRRQPIDASALEASLAAAESRDPIFLTWHQTKELESWMPEFIRRIIPVAVLTVCRVSELLGLRDRDVDFDGGSIAVYEQQQAGQRACTKSAAGRRVVDVGPLVLRLLGEQQLARAANNAALLFPSKTGRPFDRRRFYSRYFVPAAVAAGLSTREYDDEGRRHYAGITFHDLRHTGASLMIAAPAPACHPKVIAEQMGHADGGALVLRTYGHLYRGARKAAALALEQHVLDSVSAADVGRAWGDVSSR